MGALYFLNLKSNEICKRAYTPAVAPALAPHCIFFWGGESGHAHKIFARPGQSGTRTCVCLPAPGPRLGWAAMLPARAIDTYCVLTVCCTERVTLLRSSSVY